MAHYEDNYLALNPEEAKTVQQVFGTLLYYARAVDPTSIVSRNTIAAQQSKVTQETAKKVVHIMNYASTQPDAIAIYHTSGMALHMHSDASSLSAPGAKRRAGGYNYLSEPSSDPKKNLHTPC